jgi:fused signal recognition particle receptor
MFGFLKDKLKKSVTKLAEKVKETPEKPRKAEKKPKEKPKKPAKPMEKPEKKAEKPKKPARPKERPKPKPKPEPVKEKPVEEPKTEPVPEPEPEKEPEPEPEPPPKPELEPEPAKEPEPELEPEPKPEPERETKPAVEVPEPKPKPRPEPEKEVVVEEVVEEKKPGFFGRLRGAKPVKTIKKIRTIKEAVVEKTLTDADIDSFFQDSETDLLQANIALEAIDFMRDAMKKELSEKKIRRRGAEQFISKALEDSLLGLVNHGSIDLEKVIKEAKSAGKPACLVFLGFNGAGKTTSIAKVARYLMDNGHSVVLAAGDTFRAASIEQLEHHGDKLGVRVIKHKYGSDSAAVVFDARKHAEAKGIDVVLADTAGRMHTDKNLADELKKVIRVNQPELKILLVDSLTGNDAVEQAKQFHEMVGVDTVIMAKTDVNEKGGSILSVSYAIKKPILFLGTGQEYKDLKKFNPQEFVKGLVE